MVQADKVKEVGLQSQGVGSRQQGGRYPGCKGAILILKWVRGIVEVAMLAFDLAWA